MPWKTDSTAAVDLHALATSSPEERTARLRRALADRFEGHERWLDPPDEDDDGWTHLSGPTRCEACGAVRERFLSTSLTHPNYETPVLGDGWSGGTLRLGVRIASPMGWRVENEDRGYYMRLRPSPAPDTLAICGGPEHWGCGCGAGWASVIARFDVDDDGFTLALLTLRALKTPADLDDVDLVYAPACAHGRLREPWTGWRPADRAEALAHLYRAWGLTT